MLIKSRRGHKHTVSTSPGTTGMDYKKGGKINNVEKEKQIIIDRILKKLNENN